MTHKGMGVVSMAKSGPNTNNAQFFITFKTASHLDNVHSVFGRVVGGLDVLQAMEQVKTDAQDRPVKPILIAKTLVLVNPFEELDELLSAHPEMEFVQLQINYADWDNPAVQSRRCYEVARAHHKPVVIMEPVKGGMLANPPEQVARVLTQAEAGSSAASWAVRFAASLPGVITVLSGMSNVEQMRDNLSSMATFEGLTDEQRTTLDEARAELAKIPLIPCTRCNYCAKVCPKDIGISGTFTQSFNCSV